MSKVKMEIFDSFEELIHIEYHDSMATATWSGFLWHQNGCIVKITTITEEEENRDGEQGITRNNCGGA